MRLHLIAPFDADMRVDRPWLATAALTLGFAALMRLAGMEVVEYSTAGSESAAVEKVALAPAAQGTRQGFDDLLPSQLGARVKPGDVICYTRGEAHGHLPALFPLQHHVEILVGYDAAPTPGVWRVFPSRAWQAWTLGRYTPAAFYTAQNVGVVIPHWVNPDEFHPTTAPLTDRILYVGRLDAAKVGLLPALMAERPDLPWVVASGRSREEVSQLMASARVVVCPTAYLEPFGLAAVEAGMCGAPVLASDHGAFAETIDDPLLGRRLPLDRRAWLAALDRLPAEAAICRVLRRQVQIDRFGPEVIACKYARFFRGLA